MSGDVLEVLVGFVVGCALGTALGIVLLKVLIFPVLDRLANWWDAR